MNFQKLRNFEKETSISVPDKRGVSGQKTDKADFQTRQNE